MKKRIKEIPPLVHPDFKKTFHIHVDASKKGYGAILTQRPNDPVGRQADLPQGIPKDHRIIAFASSALPATHTGYTNPERECYGLYWVTEKFKEFIQGCDVVAFTNHHSLRDLSNSMKESRSSMIYNWLINISQMVRQVLHKPGKTLVIPDALSRAHVEYKIKEQRTTEELLKDLIGTESSGREQINETVTKLCKMDTNQQKDVPQNCKSGHAGRTGKSDISALASLDDRELTVVGVPTEERIKQNTLAGKDQLREMGELVSPKYSALASLRTEEMQGIHQRGPEIDPGNWLSTASSAGCSAWKSPVTPRHPHLTKNRSGHVQRNTWTPPRV